MGYLTFERTTMNYEALGRYVEGKEAAEKLAGELHAAMSNLTRLTAVGGANPGEARQYDFSAIREKLAEAEEIYGKLMTAVSAANHAAPECGRELVKVRSW